jgi:GTP pyrophosphokinase
MTEIHPEKQSQTEEDHKKAQKLVTYVPGTVHEAVLEQLGKAVPDQNGEGELASPADYTPPEELYQKLLATIRQYHPSDNLDLVERAYHVAYEAHKEQKRKSGEPYIIHPLCVAIILAELELDKETIAAGLLHDVLEDTAISYEELKEQFGEEVVLLVDGVTKLTNLTWAHDKVEVQAENLRKMFLAMAKDIRVILIKLADRLHNMRTMQYQTSAKQIEKSRETMDIYAPIAHRLGISKIKVELDDLSLKYLEPEVYNDLASKIALQKDEREAFVQSIVDEVSAHIEAADIHAQVGGRVKHFFSIYKKMKNQHKTLEEIYDLYAVRILVDSVKDCYAALGVIHEMYRPIPGRFKDYIAMPKPNMYQSLHTTLIGSNGQPFEIQIRTYEMHRTAEYGIAAHWKYKEAQSGQMNEKSEEEKLAWLRQILEWQRDESDNREFLSLIKSDLDLFSDTVFCFTPTGDVKNLPAGSNPIDFAYSIHSAVGNRMVGARVNGKMVPIDYVIQNGDQIEVITSQNSRGPSRDWLNIVKSTQAKNKINSWFKNELKEENITRGKELVSAYCKSKSVVLSDLLKPEYKEKVLKKYGFREWDAVLAAIGHGGLKEGQIVNKLMEEYQKDHAKAVTDEEVLEAVAENREKAKPSGNSSGIVVKGVKDLAVRFSKCCSPVPGDEIVGFVTRGRGISIHRTDCVNMISLPIEDRARIIPAEWQEERQLQEKYLAEFKIFANNRVGLLADLSRVFTEQQIDINSISSRTSKQGIATVVLSFETNGREQMNHIVSKIMNVAGVMDVERSQG